LAQDLVSLDSQLEQEAYLVEGDEEFLRKEGELREATEQRIRGLEGMLA
jgi:hypothetical protein